MWPSQLATPQDPGPEGRQFALPSTAKAPQISRDVEIVRRLWSAEGRVSHHGKHYRFDDVRITPKPIQQPLPAYIGSFSKPSIELAARLGCGLIVAPFAAAMTFGGLKEVPDLYHETCAKHGQKPHRLMCSYFTHFADTPEQEAAARARQIRYYKECVIPAVPADPKNAPPSYRYFIDIVDRLQKLKPLNTAFCSALSTWATLTSSAVRPK